MRQRLSMVTLGVSDLERARRFYIEGLGLTVRPESVEGSVIFIEMGSTWLALWSRAELAKDCGLEDDGSGFIPMSLAHNVPDRNDVDALYRQAIEHGAVPVKEPQETFWGGYLAYVKDPEGFLWEFTWNPTIPSLAE